MIILCFLCVAGFREACPRSACQLVCVEIKIGICLCLIQIFVGSPSLCRTCLSWGGGQESGKTLLHT